MQDKSNENLKLERIFSVSEYIEAVNIALKKFRVKVAGEITFVDDRGHIWFSIKDKADNSLLACVIWQSNYKMCGVKIKEGMEVVLTGWADIYKLSGQLKFKAETIELKGEGALKKAYDELKSKLEQEGIFAESRKKPLPEFPQKIGVITSRQGAVLNDFLNNLGKFGFQVMMVDSRVEGQEAVKELLSAFRVFEKKDIDVLVVMRGGGSLESMQAFNNEMLVREVADFPCPVVTGIGHDKDVPLLAMACDYVCSTPTQTAHAISKSWEMAPLKITQLERFIFQKFSDAVFQINRILWRFFTDMSGILGMVLKKYQGIEYKLKNYLDNINRSILWERKVLNGDGRDILAGFSRQIKSASQQILFFEQTARANDPEKNLALGYCLARKNGKIIKSVKDAGIGEDINLQMRDGEIISKVIKAINN